MSNGKENNPEENGKNEAGDSEAFHQGVLEETYAMVSHALKTGIDFDGAQLKEFEEIKRSGKIDIGKLLAIHQSLAASIQPATPAGIAYSRSSKKSLLSPFENLPPVVSHMLYLTVFFVVGFIITSNYCGIEAPAEGTTNGALECEAQFQVSLLLIFAAGIGACFFNLYKMYDYIVKSVFDPKYLASYWLRLALGIVAGFILAEMIPPDYVKGSSFGKPMLALLGGFSADAVNWTLQRLVETLKALIKGGSDAEIKKQESAIKALADVHLKKRKLELASELITFKNGLTANTKLSAEDAKRLDEMIKKL